VQREIFQISRGEALYKLIDWVNSPLCTVLLQVIRTGYYMVSYHFFMVGILPGMYHTSHFHSSNFCPQARFSEVP